MVSIVSPTGLLRLEQRSLQVSSFPHRISTKDLYNHCSGSNRTRLDDVGFLAILFSIGTLFTTIHAQDFKDVKGDALIGRKTLPIALPNFSRFSMLVGLSGWSLAMSYIWQLHPLIIASFCGLGLFISIRFMVLRSKRADQVSYYWYNVCQLSNV